MAYTRYCYFLQQEPAMSHNIAAVAAQLHKRGYRMTPQRQLILDAVCQLGGHVTPDAVYDAVQAITPALNLATVYRTLSFLGEQGILNTVLLEDGRTGYELAGAEPHHHLVCRVCGGEEQISHDAVAVFFADIARNHQFSVKSRHLTLFGVCQHCRDQLENRDWDHQGASKKGASR
jgi:Fe2+ or Zn2+ uptake regulation protein